jgi:hypothetical protein
MTQWISDVVKEINYAHKVSHTLLITKYMSSAGSVKDYVVGLLPPGGYVELVKSSLQILEMSVNSLKDIKPPQVDMSDWIVGASQLIISLRKSLQSNTEEYSSVKTPSRPLVFKDGVYTYQDEEEAEDIQTVIVRNLFIESQVDHTPAITESLLPKGKVPHAKALLRATLPVGNYLGQLNFSEGKVQDVKAVVIPE